MAVVRLKTFGQTGSTHLARGNGTRLRRPGERQGHRASFLDQRLPAYEREIMNMVGMGVTENAELRPHVKAGAHGFSMAISGRRKERALRASPRNRGSVPSHLMAAGRCSARRRAEAHARSQRRRYLCNVPIGIYRGFRNVFDNPDALLVAVVGGPARRQGRLASFRSGRRQHARPGSRLMTMAIRWLRNLLQA